MEAILYIFVGIALFYWAFKFRSNIKNIAKNGEQVEGIVFDTVQNSDPQSNLQYPIIRFVTLKKEWITEQYNVSTPGLSEKGRKLMVVYNPDIPKEFFVKSSSNSIFPILLSIGGVIVVAIGVYKLLRP